MGDQLWFSYDRLIARADRLAIEVNDLTLPNFNANGHRILTDLDIGGGVTSVGPVNATPIDDAMDIDMSHVLHGHLADGTHPGFLGFGAQTIGGDKTFLGNITANNLSGSNTGNVTIGAFGGSPTANGLSLAGQVITQQPADGTRPGALTAGDQTIGGVKTFGGNVHLTGDTYFDQNPAKVFFPNTCDGEVDVINRSQSLWLNGIAPSSDSQVCPGLFELESGILHISNLSSIYDEPPSSSQKYVIAIGDADDEVGSYQTTRICHDGSFSTATSNGQVFDTFGTVAATGQACSPTVPASIAFGTLDRANNAKITVASNKFRIADDSTVGGAGTLGDYSGVYEFTLALMFDTGSTAWRVQMRTGAHGGALANTGNPASGVTAPVGLGTSGATVTLRYFITPSTDTDIDFQITADSFPVAATVRTLQNTSTISFEYRPLFDTA